MKKKGKLKDFYGVKQSAPVNKLARVLSWIIAVIFLLLPFHAFITVWLSSLFGQYTLLRLWKEFLLVLLMFGSLYILLKNREIISRMWNSRLIKLIVLYIALLAISAIWTAVNDEIAAKAIWYGLLVDLRFLIFFLAVIVIASRSDWLAKRWQILLFVPAILVAAFAVLQYLVLPYDFLKHFGYNDTTISPYETINNNINRLRVASTLRGPNPLGAYLILPLCALAVWLLAEKRERRDKILFGSGLLLALIFSFSRSAWIGFLLGVAVVAWYSIKSSQTKRRILIGAGVFAIAASAGAFALRNNHAFQDTVFHTNDASTIKVSSNYGHREALEDAVSDIYHQPLGGGVGSAGPQSFYSDRQIRISENYYLQIGQETGLVGMAIFIAIIFLVGFKLYAMRAEPLALALLASLIGLSFIGLLAHVWTDDTIAYVWWGMAAICLSPVIITDRLKPKNGKKIKKTA